MATGGVLNGRMPNSRRDKQRAAQQHSQRLIDKQKLSIQNLRKQVEVLHSSLVQARFNDDTLSDRLACIKAAIGQVDGEQICHIDRLRRNIAAHCPTALLSGRMISDLSLSELRLVQKGHAMSPAKTDLAPLSAHRVISLAAHLPIKPQLDTAPATVKQAELSLQRLLDAQNQTIAYLTGFVEQITQQQPQTKQPSYVVIEVPLEPLAHPGNAKTSLTQDVRTDLASTEVPWVDMSLYASNAVLNPEFHSTEPDIKPGLLDPALISVDDTTLEQCEPPLDDDDDASDSDNYILPPGPAKFLRDLAKKNAQAGSGS